jgi:hypothetical protein
VQRRSWHHYCIHKPDVTCCLTQHGRWRRRGCRLGRTSNNPAANRAGHPSDRTRHAITNTYAEYSGKHRQLSLARCIWPTPHPWHTATSRQATCCLTPSQHGALETAQQCSTASLAIPPHQAPGSLPTTHAVLMLPGTLRHCALLTCIAHQRVQMPYLRAASANRQASPCEAAADMPCITLAGGYQKHAGNGTGEPARPAKRHAGGWHKAALQP